MIDDTLDVVIACMGLVWLLGLAIFGAGRGRGRSGATASARVWPWVVAGPVVVILSCLAYFLFGGP